MVPKPFPFGAETSREAAIFNGDAQMVVETGLVEALRESEQKYRELFTAGPDAIVVIDEKTSRIVDVNAAAAELYGYAREEFLELSCGDIVAEREAPEPTVQETSTTRSRTLGRRRHKKKGGFVFVAEIATRAVLLDGRSILIQVIRDISDRPGAEPQMRRLAALFAASNEIQICFDSHGAIVGWNRGAERLYGYSEAEAMRMNIRELLPERWRKEELALIDRVWAGEAIAPFETQHVAKSGRRVNVCSHISLLHDPAGNPSECVAIEHDITERRMLERAINDSASQERRRIGHDIHDGMGQELIGLRNYAKTLAVSLAARDAPEGEIADLLADGLQHVIEQLRIIVNGLVPVDIEAAGLMTALANLTQTTQVRGGIPCRFECPGPMLVEDHHVAMHLFRIAQEAVNNALKHAAPRRITVRLDRGDDGTTLMVHDDGIGMQTMSREGEGGMGLRIMRYRAEHIGATLKITTPEGGGTLVSCSIPPGD